MQVKISENLPWQKPLNLDKKSNVWGKNNEQKAYAGNTFDAHGKPIEKPNSNVDRIQTGKNQAQINNDPLQSKQSTSSDIKKPIQQAIKSGDVDKDLVKLVERTPEIMHQMAERARIRKLKEEEEREQSRLRALAKAEELARKAKERNELSENIDSKKPDSKQPDNVKNAESRQADNINSGRKERESKQPDNDGSGKWGNVAKQNSNNEFHRANLENKSRGNSNQQSWDSEMPKYTWGSNTENQEKTHMQKKFTISKRPIESVKNEGNNSHISSTSGPVVNSSIDQSQNNFVEKKTILKRETPIISPDQTLS